MEFIKSRWYGEGRTVPIRVIVIHDMEAPEGPLTAENVAAYFARGTVKSSAHVCVDNNSAVRCVADGDRAWHAPGANSDGLGLELAGYARQSRAEWLDQYSKGVLENAAKVTAGWCKKHDIPARKLTVAELKAGKRGIVGHVDVSKAWGQTNHTDPGPNFPWDYFLSRVNALLNPKKPTTLPAPVTKPGAKYTPPKFPKGLRPNSSTPSATALQRALKAAGFMNKSVPESANYGPKTQEGVGIFHRKYPQYAKRGSTWDVAIGPKGWSALFKLAYGK